MSVFKARKAMNTRKKLHYTIVLTKDPYNVYFIILYYNLSNWKIKKETFPRAGHTGYQVWRKYTGICDRV